MDVDADNIATFPNGLRLKLTPEELSPQLIAEAFAAGPEPTVPTRWIADDGRWEENPDDPEYRAARADAENKRAWAAVRDILVLGTDLVDAPAGVTPLAGFPTPKVAVVLARRGVTVPDDPLLRYEMWLRYYGMGSSVAALREFADLLTWLLQKSGNTNEGALGVIATFRDRAGRGADPASGDVAAVAHGAGDSGAAAELPAS